MTLTTHIYHATEHKVHVVSYMLILMHIFKLRTHAFTVHNLFFDGAVQEMENLFDYYYYACLIDNRVINLVHFFKSLQQIFTSKTKMVKITKLPKWNAWVSS